MNRNGIGVKGPFTGFTFNGVHSSDLGITRVSGSNLYSSNILPNFQDINAAVPGGDGTYYWGSNFTQKPFPISIAFDNMSEIQFRRLKTVLSTKDISELIFDEEPYKVYSAKIQSAPQLSWICFEDDEGRSIYKGNGTLTFVSYYPFARNRFKTLEEYNLDNVLGWKNSRLEYAGMANYDVYVSDMATAKSGASLTCYDYDYPTDTTKMIYVRWYERYNGWARIERNGNLYEPLTTYPEGAVLPKRDENGRISYLIDKTGTHSTISRLNDTPPVRKTFSDGTPVFFVYTKNDGTKALTTCQQLEERIDKPFSRLYLSDQININDWAFNSSGIYSNDGITNKEYNITKNPSFIAFNGGDIPTPPRIYIMPTAGGLKGDLTIQIKKVDSDEVLGSLELKNLPQLDSNIYLQVNTKNNLIVGYNKNTKKLTGTLYNQYITSGDFFNIPVSEIIKTNTYTPFDKLTKYEISVDDHGSGCNAVIYDVAFEYLYI